MTSTPADFRPEATPVPTGAAVAAALVREDAWERLESVRRFAGVAQGSLDLGDGRGADYALARILVYLTSVSASLRELDGKTLKAAA